ncbi:hypothetical protein GE061_009210 [Apolygus lucorum]|uniref:ATP synthase F(0) complex subunit e, mitochondrial n=1 Tax=Apolygus lucorum TaxID=248454 RepID=A0A6A4KFU1_APOLU|nr:hypothetical protein GE061_009210 [Apolygus lucorum]
MVRDFPPPFKVSPLIKFFRYLFLVAGIRQGWSNCEEFRTEERLKQGKNLGLLERQLLDRIAALKDKPYEPILTEENTTKDTKDEFKSSEKN